MSGYHDGLLHVGNSKAFVLESLEICESYGVVCNLLVVLSNASLDIRLRLLSKCSNVCHVKTLTRVKNVLQQEYNCI